MNTPGSYDCVCLNGNSNQNLEQFWDLGERISVELELCENSGINFILILIILCVCILIFGTISIAIRLVLTKYKHNYILVNPVAIQPRLEIKSSYLLRNRNFFEDHENSVHMSFTTRKPYGSANSEQFEINEINQIFTNKHNQDSSPDTCSYQLITLSETNREQTDSEIILPNTENQSYLQREHSNSNQNLESDLCSRPLPRRPSPPDHKNIYEHFISD